MANLLLLFSHLETLIQRYLNEIQVGLQVIKKQVGRTQKPSATRETPMMPPPDLRQHIAGLQL